MADQSIVHTHDLRKRYAPGVDALRGLDLDVQRGSICGFLGRNGAGKTTTIKILLGMTRPTAGDAHVFGLDATDVRACLEIRRRTGFVSEEKDLYDSFSVDEMIRFTAPFFPNWRADLEAQYVHAFDLPRERLVRALSRGMRTKLALLLALCRGAELLVLDEATSGLDPAAAEEVLQALVSHVAREEATVFFSSHQLAEVEQIADTVAIADRGRTVVAGPLDDLRDRFRRVQIVFDGEAPQAPFRAPGVERVAREGRVLTVWTSAGVEPVLGEARALGPVSVDVAAVSLKEIFLETVGAKE